MDIRQLKFFLAVVDHNGFSRAAQHLMVAQPSLSQAIATFERELGMPLFHRIGRGVVLSEAGAALVGPARVVLRDLDEAKATMRALKGLRGGRIDLVTMPSPGMEPLTTILTTFSRAHPDVTVNAEAAFTPEEVLALVRTGSAEIGVLGSAEPTQAADLDVIPLERQALVLISGPDDDGPTGRQHFARRPHRVPTHRLPTRLADAGTRRRRPRQRNRSQHRRRNRPPHIDFADGSQRTRAGRHARILDRISPPLRRPGPNHHTRDLPARRRRQPTHPPHHTGHRTHGRSPRSRCTGPSCT